MNKALTSPVKRLDSKPVFMALLGAGLAFFSLAACAASPLVSTLANMSIEDLANIQITSVSKKSERLADAAASVYVITADDIRRSGATSLPDALRLAPNLQVAQASGSGYAITARGFNGSNNSSPNKLLVLIDGRSVYTPLFSGVFWDVQDVMLEDVERIEVISGPGGTLWGTNAVNGVINIITRPAGDTQGNLATLEAGNKGGDTAFRHGGTLGADGNYRVYGKYFNRGRTLTESGSKINDALHHSQAGFRADWDRGGDRFMVQGNAYTGAEEQPEPGSISISGTNLTLGGVDVSGVNLTTHWGHALDDGGKLDFQAYYDRTERTIVPTLSEKLNIVDMQLQHSLRPLGMHAIVWGADYRYSMDRVDNTSPVFAFLPADVDQKWASLFAQDEMSLSDDLRLTIGTRFEHNDYTGTELLPNARLAWKLAPDHLLWTAVSRTVRAPSRLDRDSHAPAGPPFQLNGGPDANSEVAKVFEVGYRGQPTSRISYSITAFHTVYDDLRTLNFDPSGSFIVFSNDMEGTTTGIETWGTYQASPKWRLSAGLSALRERLRLKPGGIDTQAPNAAGNDPAHSWQLRSSSDLGSGRELDLTLRHVAALKMGNVPAPMGNVPAYTAVDARLGWKLRHDLEFSVTGQNLFGHHAEYGSLANRTDLSPGIFLKLLWKN
jgi:iron complex outermembrane receptor protein